MLLPFKFPAAHSELREHSTTHYSVQKFIAEIDATNINLIFNDLNAIYHTKEYEAVLVPVFFDDVYSILCSFKDLSDELLHNVWRIIIKGTSDLHAHLCSVLPHNTDPQLSVSGQQRLRNILKIYLYFLSWIAFEFESAESLALAASEKDGIRNMGSTSAKRGPASSQTSGTGSSLATASSSAKPKKTDLQSCQETSILLLEKIFELPLTHLWPMSTGIETEVFSSVARLVTKLYENTRFIKSGMIKAHIFNIMFNITAKNGYEYGFTATIISTILKYESLTVFFADMLALFNKRSKVATSRYLMVIISEISNMDFSVDSAESKNALRFLLDLTERIPAEVYRFVSILYPHMNNKQFTVRTHMLEIIAKILVKVLCKPTSAQNPSQEVDTNHQPSSDLPNDPDTNQYDKFDTVDTVSRESWLGQASNNSRDEFLGVLLAHCLDENSFVRRKAIMLWGILCEEKAIPIQFFPDVLSTIVGRFRDKTKLVRQQSIQTLRKFIVHNQFGKVLKLTEFTKLYEDEEKQHTAIVERLAQRFEYEQKNQYQDRLREKRLSASFHSNMMREDTASVKPVDNSLVLTMGIIQEIESLFQQPELALEDNPEIMRVLKILNAPNNELKVHELSPHERTAYIEDLKAKYQRKLSVFLNESTEYKSRERLLKFLSDALCFINEIHQVLPYICHQLTSNATSDLIEAIDFVHVAFDHQIEAVCSPTSNSTDCVRRILYLIHHPDTATRDKVVNLFIHFNFSEETIQAKLAASASDPQALLLETSGELDEEVYNKQVFRNLLLLLNETTSNSLKALEILLHSIDKTKPFPDRVIEFLFGAFCLKMPNITEETSYKALIVLSFLSKSRPHIIQANLPLFIQYGLGERSRYAPIFSQYTAVCLKNLYLFDPKTDIQATTLHRLQNASPVFEAITNLLLFVPESMNVAILSTLNSWYASAGNLIDAIYSASDQPAVILSSIIKGLYKNLLATTSGISQHGLGDAANNTSAITSLNQTSLAGTANATLNDLTFTQTSAFLSEDLIHFAEANTKGVVIITRLLFILGHTSLCHLVHMETIGLLLKNRKAKEERNRMDDIPPIKAYEESSKRKKMDDSLFISDIQEPEQDLGLSSVVNDDDEPERLAFEVENTLLMGNTLLHEFLPLVERICRTKCNDKFLGPPAVMTLCKLMCVSSVYCEKLLPILFTILETGSLEEVKVNIIVALGDLSFRFPNCIEPWTSEIYMLLERNNNTKVLRKTALFVISHLILNNMIKAKGKYGNIAACLVDPEQDISSLARVFFAEISKKDKGIYNVLPDIVGYVSSTFTNDNSNTLKTIFNQLLPYIDKEKQLESLFDKFLQRFSTLDSVSGWTDNAYCLTKLVTSEKAFMKLTEKLDCLKRALCEDPVYALFLQIAKDAERYIKPENRSDVERYREKIQSIFHSNSVDSEPLEMNTDLAIEAK